MLGAWLLGPLAALLIGMARTWQGLVPGLLLYALSAYCIPVVNAYVAHAVDGRNLERAFAVVYAGYTAGGIVSPAVGGWLAELTGMRTVYFAAAGLFALSAVVVVLVSPQPVIAPAEQRAPHRALLNRRFLRFTILTWLVFVAMYLGFPFAPNFLADVRGWDVARVGLLGSFQALGMTLLLIPLGRLGREGSRWGFVVGQALVWGAALLLLTTRAFPLLALAFLMRGAYQGLRSLTQARVSTMAQPAERGLLLGASETTVALAQVLAPFLAGLLYAADPARPFGVSLALIPLGSLAVWVWLPRPRSSD